MHRRSIRVLGLGGLALAVGGAALAVAMRPLHPSPPGAMNTGAAADPSIPQPPVTGPWMDVAWQRIVHPALDPPVEVQVQGSATDGTRVIAWGEAFVANPEQSGTVWLSRSTPEWERLDFGGAAAAPGWPDGVALGPHAAVMLVRGGLLPDRLMWSADGVTWLPAMPVPRGVQLNRVVALGDRFAAVGENGFQPTIWISPDGRAWAEAAVPAFPPATDVGLAGIVDIGGRWLAFGSASTPVGMHAVLLRSTDLVDWQRIAADDPALTAHAWTGIQAIHRFGDALLASGHAGDEQCRGLVLAASGSGGPRTADICLGPGAATWRSADGATWERVIPRIGDPRRFVSDSLSGADAVPAGDGLLSIELEQDRQGGDGWTAALWTTGDGRTWRRLAELPPEAQSHRGLMIRDGRIALVAQGGGSVEVWSGTPIGP